MKEDDTAERKKKKTRAGSSKRALDFRGEERGGGNEREKSGLFLFGSARSVANRK